MKKIRWRTVKIILFSIFSVIVISLTGIYTNAYQNNVIKETSAMLSTSNVLTQLYMETENMQRLMGEYISIDSTESHSEYYGCQKKLQDYQEILSTQFTNSVIGVMFLNVSNMITSYIDNCEAVIFAKNKMQSDTYTEGYENTSKQCVITVNYIKSAVAAMLENAERYAAISQMVENQSRMNILFIGGAIVFIVASIIQSIFKYMDDINKQARIAQKFNEQKLKNLAMKNALHESELMALQAQINPHFIFNTINIGAKMAMLNGDDATCEYLENASDIFRYNLKGLDVKTTLKEEIDNARAYLFLLSTRFGDLFTFKFDIDESLLDSEIPRMSLQPIIENAYIHGISSMETNGMITVAVYSEQSIIAVEITDNGKGMSENQIAEILQSNDLQDGSVKYSGFTKSHTTGIGMHNVINRMKLFFDSDDVIEISCDDKGTHVKLRIPKGGGNV